MLSSAWPYFLSSAILAGIGYPAVRGGRQEQAGRGASARGEAQAPGASRERRRTFRPIQPPSAHALAAMMIVGGVLIGMGALHAGIGTSLLFVDASSNDFRLPGPARGCALSSDSSDPDQRRHPLLAVGSSRDRRAQEDGPRSCPRSARTGRHPQNLELAMNRLATRSLAAGALALALGAWSRHRVPADGPHGPLRTHMKIEKQRTTRSCAQVDVSCQTDRYGNIHVDSATVVAKRRGVQTVYPDPDVVVRSFRSRTRSTATARHQWFR